MNIKLKNKTKGKLPQLSNWSLTYPVPVKIEITLNDDDESLDWTMMAVVPEGDDKGKTSNIVKWTTHKAPINDQEFLVTNWTNKFKQH